jgi:hypothetical protein
VSQIATAVADAFLYVTHGMIAELEIKRSGQKYTRRRRADLVIVSSSLPFRDKSCCSAKIRLGTKIAHAASFIQGGNQ